MKPFCPAKANSQRARILFIPAHPQLRLLLLAVISVLVCEGCAHRPHVARQPAATPSGPPPAVEQQPPIPGQYVETGTASWYGAPFNGHRTSSGEIYDMHGFTAAHRTLPFGAVLRVTNLNNGKQIDVRVNDRGPFVANRIIDLSLSAAQAIQMIGAGTAPVRLEMVSGPNPAVGSFGVQVGAFLVLDNAQRLRDQLSLKYSFVNVVPYDSPNGLFYRVRVGRVPSIESAEQLAARLRAEAIPVTFVVRLDD